MKIKKKLINYVLEREYRKDISLGFVVFMFEN